MKYIYSLPFFLIALNASSQKLDSIGRLDGDWGYQQVIQLDSSATKSQLYKNAKVFFVDNFKSANSVIQYDDSTEGKIIGKGFFRVMDAQMVILSSVVETWDIYFSTEITCKDGKYRYKIYDIQADIESRTNGGYPTRSKATVDDLYQYAKKGMTKKLDAKLINKSVISFNETIAAIKKYMSKNTQGSKDDF